MDSKVSAPRITAPYLDSFNGRHVTLVGKVTQLRGDQAVVDSDGAITLLLNRV
jgi:replication factor A3